MTLNLQIFIIYVDKIFICSGVMRQWLKYLGIAMIMIICL